MSPYQKLYPKHWRLALVHTWPNLTSALRCYSMPTAVLVQTELFSSHQMDRAVLLDEVSSKVMRLEVALGTKITNGHAERSPPYPGDITLTFV